jgi:hypothetical protein
MQLNAYKREGLRLNWKKTPLFGASDAFMKSVVERIIKPYSNRRFGLFSIPILYPLDLFTSPFRLSISLLIYPISWARGNIKDRNEKIVAQFGMMISPFVVIVAGIVKPTQLIIKRFKPPKQLDKIRATDSLRSTQTTPSTLPSNRLTHSDRSASLRSSDASRTAGNKPTISEEGEGEGGAQHPH